MVEEGNKPTPLQTSSVESLLKTLPPNWGPTTLDSSIVANTLGIRGATIVAVAASGIPPSSDALLMYGRPVLAGFTVVRQEPPDGRRPGEPECNIDHYILCECDHARVQYCRYGPYRTHDDMAKNAGLPHWPDYGQFSLFVQGLQE